MTAKKEEKEKEEEEEEDKEEKEKEVTRGQEYRGGRGRM